MQGPHCHHVSQVALRKFAVTCFAVPACDALYHSRRRDFNEVAAVIAASTGID